MDLRKAIEGLEGSRGEIHFCFLPEEEIQWQKTELAIVVFGRNSVTRTTLYEKEEVEPYIIKAIDADVRGVRIHAQWSRPATAEEIAAARNHEDRHEQTKTFVATTIA